jgi:hypothetical protein
MQQQGATLMIMLVIMVLGTATYLVNSFNSTAVQTARDKLTADALAQAKNALIAYAVTYADNNLGSVHGYLPCSDDGTRPEGEATGTCGNKDESLIGKLPWKTLGLEPLKDSSGTCLWYAVSGTYKNSPKTTMMNDDNQGLFRVMAPDGVTLQAGSSVENRAVAVIFAPGSAISQSRPFTAGSLCGGTGSYTASGYLDNDTVHGINNSVVSATANAVSTFVAGPVRPSGDLIVNDRLAFITKDDIFDAINRRADFVNAATNPLRLMTKAAAECIADYGRYNTAGASDKRLPWSARSSAADDIDCNYRDGTSTTRIMYGRLPNRVSGSQSSTNNLLATSSCSGTSSRYQLKISNCPLGWATYSPWWSNWKDHVFYSVGYNYRPLAGTSSSCSAGSCLTVNGTGLYAAIVAFSGKKLASQTRSTSSAQLDFANYLEGNNFKSSIPITTSGNGDYQSGAATASFNDVLYCIMPDLSVEPC